MSTGTPDFPQWHPRIWLFLRTLLLLLLYCTECSPGTVNVEKSVTAVLGLDVTLTCYYEAEEGEKVSQVLWLKVLNGKNNEIANLNAEFGSHIYPEYEGRVKKKNPLQSEDGTIILKNPVQADEGTYQCRVITFPSGTFEADMMLKVLVPPLPTLNPGPPLVEGEGQTLAASCTAEGNPVPSLIWETQVMGTNKSRTFHHSRSASVTGEFYVLPARSMNGKPLTCVISHPGFREEKRITHMLSVKYIAEATIQGHEGWFVGKEGAELQCVCEGNPMPTYKWSRANGSLPEDVKYEGNKLVFPGVVVPTYAGLYSCQAINEVGARQASGSVFIAEHEPRNVDLMSVSLVSVAVVTVVLLVILVITVVLVNRHHKRKTKRLSEKIEELSTLSRQTSRRRLSTSASTDTRMQLEEGLPLRGGHHPDSLRDPSISSMMGEEMDRRSYSTLTTVRETETQTELLSTVPDEDVKEESEGEQEDAIDEKELDQCERDSTGIIENQPFIKQGMTHFYQENGTMRAKPTTNGIYINGRGHLV
ncbi:nectin-4 [Hyperolius riggenbachi]|uniref:nectin-4 n=1 Tax=Hyperolius riggenbachi TaxID=752182 RepID=UPI0035A33683